MKVKLGRLVSSEPAMVSLFGGIDLNGNPVPPPRVSMKMSYTLSLLYKAVSPHLNEFRSRYLEFQAQMKDLRAKLAEAQADEEHDELSAQIDQLTQELNELLGTDVVMPGIGRIRLDKFEREGLHLTRDEFDALSWLVKGSDDDSLFEHDASDNDDAEQGDGQDVE